MTGLQAQIRGDRRRKPGALPAATVVCLFLMALLAVVQVAHTHTLESDADHCPLCIVMHSAAPVVVAAAVVVLVKSRSMRRYMRRARWFATGIPSFSHALLPPAAKASFRFFRFQPEFR